MQGVPEQKLRAHLGSFGVTGNLALQPMYTLSGNESVLIDVLSILKAAYGLSQFHEKLRTILLPNDSSARRILNLSVLIRAFPIPGGQKSRVAFAKITFKKPHIILLDEPSNHLVSKSPCFFLYVLLGGYLFSPLCKGVSVAMIYTRG